ncbi:MAG: ATP-binding cassette domain-containing protein, partial [Vibrio cyclitrophicus]
MDNLIQLDSVSVEFDGRKVLDNISLNLERGRITTLIGPNGAGKSTLVKVLLGLQNKYSGKITKSKKLKIGYVPQKLKLNDSLPLNVERFLKLTGKFSK